MTYVYMLFHLGLVRQEDSFKGTGEYIAIYDPSMFNFSTVGILQCTLSQ